MTESARESAQWTRVDDGRFQVDLLTADYQRHAFTRHNHATYSIGVVVSAPRRSTTRGAAPRGRRQPRDPRARRAARRAGRGPAGWAYRVFYPPADAAARGARPAGTFAEPIVHDPRSAHAGSGSAHEALTGRRRTVAAHSKLAWAMTAV